MDNRPIGVFDSGVGGITVLKEIIKLLPNENILYLGDTARMPYGTKSKENIIEYTKQSINFLINKNVKAIVIACGTATSQALEEIQININIPIIGIINPTVYSIDKTYKEIGVIATTGTINSGAWEKNIKNTCSGMKVISVSCPLLAQMAEEGWLDNEIARLTIKEYLNSFKGTNISALILGCTHYPLFKKLIEEELGEKVEIIDTGEKTSKALKQLLEDKNLLNLQNLKPEYKMYLTDIGSSFINIAKMLLKDIINIDKSEIIKIEL